MNPQTSLLKVTFPCGYRFQINNIIATKLEMPLCPLHEKDCPSSKRLKGSFKVSIKKRVKKPVKKIAKRKKK